MSEYRRSLEILRDSTFFEAGSRHTFNPPASAVRRRSPRPPAGHADSLGAGHGRTWAAELAIPSLARADCLGATTLFAPRLPGAYPRAAWSPAGARVFSSSAVC